MNEDPVRATPWRPYAKRDTKVSETQGQICMMRRIRNLRTGRIIETESRSEVLWGYGVGKRTLLLMTTESLFGMRRVLEIVVMATPVMNVITATELHI